MGVKVLDTPEAKTDIRSIYVLPTKNGCIFMVAVLVMWLFGVNYDNNLVLLTALFALSCFLSSVFLTWNNLRGISFFPELSERELRSGGGVPVSFRISTQHKLHGIRISSSLSTSTPYMECEAGRSVSILLKDQGRGIFRCPRLCISSDYPLGLVRSFFYIRTDAVAMVFPADIPCEFFPVKDLQNMNAGGKKVEVQTTSDLGRGTDEISGLRRYREGDPLNLVDWKQLARGRGLMVREFSPDASSCVSLREDSVRAANYEERISKLAHAVGALATSGVRFGLDMPGAKVSPGSGEVQRVRVLKALALLPKEDGL